MKLTENLRAAALKKFARGLLTTTCLTAAAAGMAQAGVVNESSVSGADFGNTFALRNDLLSGVTEVIGGLSSAGDSDFFQVDGFLAGSSYTITGLNYTNSARYGVLDSSQGSLNALTSNPPTLTGIVPGDGILVIQVQSNEQPATYDLGISATTGTPEPATLGVVGLALAAGYALRRKLAK